MHTTHKAKACTLHALDLVPKHAVCIPWHRLHCAIACTLHALGQGLIEGHHNFPLPFVRYLIYIPTVVLSYAVMTLHYANRYSAQKPVYD